jgi:hypothetical protein
MVIDDDEPVDEEPTVARVDGGWSRHAFAFACRPRRR